MFGVLREANVTNVTNAANQAIGAPAGNFGRRFLQAAAAGSVAPKYTAS